jgi:hypothetical protein
MYVPISLVDMAEESIDWFYFDAKNSNLQLGQTEKSRTIILI